MHVQQNRERKPPHKVYFDPHLTANLVAIAEFCTRLSRTLCLFVFYIRWDHYGDDIIALECVYHEALLA